MSLFHRLTATLLDGASFGFINTWQLFRPPPKGFHAEFNRYIQTHQATSPQDYYAIDTSAVFHGSMPVGQLRFPTPIPCEFPSNNSAVFDLYPCFKGWTAPTMILGHGLMSVSAIGYRYWASRLNALGWNAVFMHMPYHYDRRPAWYLSGELCINANLIRFVETLRQAVKEVRLLMNLLEREGCTKIGGWGTSYSGWVFALTGCVDARLSRLMLIEPILNAETASWKSPATATLRFWLQRAKISAETMRKHHRLCCPSHMKPQTSPDKVMMVAGLYDQIAPPEEIQALHEAWKGSHYYAFDQGHVGYRLMPESLRLAQELWPEDFFQT